MSAGGDAKSFKAMTPVPTSKDFIDVVLSKTQRKTPTVVRKGWKISRIRNFYMRKVKYTCQNYHEKLTLILDEFPRLDDVHPFYADLVNVLYSRDHYKLALGQVNTARTLIDNLCKDYLRLLKFGDSLYRCKQLKRASLGRMCTLLKKLGPSLAYLEQVRQHVARLPQIDPNSRTLMITGYPNVGKSSFMNKVSRANVDVQPYAFTTKSLFVGHCDYRYMRWQVIDTPGILDHPLEERNTIEMQAITALAHLQSTVLYFVDISETCGYSIKQQVALYHSIKPLFANKPLLIVANKTDLKTMDQLDDEDRALIQSIAADKNSQLIPMSNATEEGIDLVKTTACDLLLAHRVERKFKSKKAAEVVNRIHVAYPTKRDDKVREASIPEAVLASRGTTEPKVKRRTLRDVEVEQGGPGIFNFDYRHHRLLDNPEWKFDIIPEIIDGKNIADFIDPDIEARLAELEAEEEELERRAEAENAAEESESELDSETEELYQRVKTKKDQAIRASILQGSNNKPVLPRRGRTRSLADAADEMEERGIDTAKFREASRSRAQAVGQVKAAVKASGKRHRDEMVAKMAPAGDAEMGGAAEGDGSMADDTPVSKTQAKKLRAESRSASRRPSHSAVRGRSASVPRDQQGLKDKSAVAKAIRHRSQSQKRAHTKGKHQTGEADRKHSDKKPKHLFSGKSTIGSGDWR